MLRSILVAILGFAIGLCVSAVFLGYAHDSETLMIFGTVAGAIIGLFIGAIWSASLWLTETSSGYKLITGKSPILDCVAWMATSKTATVLLVAVEIICLIDCVAIVFLGLYGLYAGMTATDMKLVLLSVAGAPLALLSQFTIIIIVARVANVRPTWSSEE